MDAGVYSYLTKRRLDNQTPGDTNQLRDEVGRQLVLVTVDEKSVESLGLSWPIPRATYADIIQRLDRLGAKSIALDILFSEASNSPEQDQILAQALKNPKVLLTHPLDVESRELRRIGIYPEFVKDWSKEDLERRLGFTMDWSPVNQRRFAPVRLGQKGHKPFYSLATTLLAHYRDMHPAELLSAETLDEQSFEIKDLRIDALGGQVNFKGYGLPEQSLTEVLEHSIGEVIQVIPLADLLSIEEESLQPGLLESDRFMALVGVTTLAGFDEKETIVGKMSGVEIHVNILFNMIQDDFVRGNNRALTALLVLVFGALLGVAGARLEQKPMMALVVSLFGCVWLVGLLGCNGSLGATLWAPLFGPTFAIGALTVVVAILRQQADRGELSKVLAILQDICPAADMEQVLKDGGLKPGGERRQLTVMFSDLRDYTTFVEQLPDAQAVLDFLNIYYGSVAEVLKHYGGVVLDYQGDAQMIVFGLMPASERNHAAAAIKAGAEMIMTLDRLRKTESVAGISIPDTGVGICTGDVSFGVLGNENRKQYVAIGDPTNTAARLQGKSAVLGVRVLAAEITRVLAGDEVMVNFEDAVPLKGKKNKVRTYSANIEEMVEAKMIRPGGLPSK